MDLNTVKEEIDDSEVTSYMFHAPERTNVKKEDDASNEFIGGLM